MMDHLELERALFEEPRETRCAHSRETLMVAPGPQGALEAQQDLAEGARAAGEDGWRTAAGPAQLKRRQAEDLAGAVIDQRLDQVLDQGHRALDEAKAFGMFGVLLQPGDSVLILERAHDHGDEP